MSATSYLLERAWVDGAVRDDVLVEIVDGRFTSVTSASEDEKFPRPTGDPVTLPGLTLPGLANCHSHAFHRALRGRTQRERGTFWTWRDQMYGVAERLTPDTYFELARATYREMAATGITTVGEFHYLHHQPDGRPYADPNAMGHALVAAAREAGIRICLLDTMYLSSGFGKPPEGVQRRYSDKSASGWVVRVDELDSRYDETPGVVIGSAAHSVRAVPPDGLRRLEEWSAMPFHVHLSEQVAENQACHAAHGCTPTELLHRHGLLTGDTTVVHATHLFDEDIRILGRAQVNACLTPTTERDLGDGIGPGRALAKAGARITLGSDSHAVIDLFEEMRALEMDERLATQQRGHWTAAKLIDAATAHASLGFDDAGEIAVGRRADLVTIDTRSTRTAGTGADEHTAAFAATAADVTHVVADGRVVASRDDHEQLGRDLADAIRKVHR